jgi:uncharacterized coiled-coil protein SlyX
MTSQSLEQRVTQLEELFTYHQHLVQQLNEVAVELRADLETLSKRVATQQKQIEWLTQNNSPVDDREEKPPHY